MSSITTLAENWSPEDAGLRFKILEHQRAIELKSPRVFLDPPVVNQVTHSGGVGVGALTQLIAPFRQKGVDSHLPGKPARAGTNATPYSMVTAAGPPYTPADMRDDEILVNEWLADDLHVKPGDSIELTYFVPESGAKLVESTNRFRVHGIVPLAGIYADRTLMPDFPGIEKAESTHDWDAGFPVDLTNPARKTRRIGKNTAARPRHSSPWPPGRGCGPTGSGM